MSKKVLENDTTVHKPYVGDQDSLYEQYTNYLERQGYLPESRDYREVDSRSLGEYRGPSVRVSHDYSLEMCNRQRFEYSYRDYENTPRNREREPAYVSRYFYARNPKGFENPVTFSPGYQNRHKVEGSNQNLKNLKAPFFNGETSFKDFLIQFELISRMGHADNGIRVSNMTMYTSTGS